MQKRKNVAVNKEFEIPSLWKKILLGVILIFCGLFFIHKIIFINADLGRHIRNGEIITSNLGSGNPQEFSLFNANYYSYTEPGFQLVNHHWASGVIFYFIWKFFGFAGLTLFHAIMNVATLFVFFRIAEKRSGFLIALLGTLLAVPLFTFRTEIRPEAFSYLLSGLYLLLMEKYSDGSISVKKLLLVILPLQILWTNLHLFFVVGLFYIVIYWFSAIIKKEKTKELSIVLVASLIVSFINPNGWNGFIEPFLILREYGYMIAENQNIFFMQGRFPDNLIYLHFEILFALTVFIAARRLILSREVNVDPHLIIFLVFSFLAFKMIRAIPFWGLFFIPFFSGNISNYPKAGSVVMQRILLAGIFIILGYGLLAKQHYYSPFKGFAGLGLIENVNRSADFIKKYNLQGPIFNNYDIGGYFIYHLFPDQRVFVDNRPEAYSVDFFKKIYEPMQESEDKWKELSENFGINCIYFFRHDNTTHAQPFLIRRINDPQWAPVFADDYAIIFLKRNEKNAESISRYELPKSIFTAVPQ